MSTSSKPTIVIVIGAWHNPTHYAPLSQRLLQLGYEVITPSLPSVGGSQASFDEDVTVVRDVIEPLTRAGKRVVMLMHSYGGVVGGEAAKGLDVASVGSSGGVVKLIYLCAFALPEGVGLWDALQRQPLPWFVDVNEKQWGTRDAHDIFYNDVNKDIAESCIDGLANHAKGVFLSKCTWSAWATIDSAYIVCEKDAAIPAAAQRGMAQSCGMEVIETIDASHSPFLSKPDETATTVSKIIGY